MRSWRSLGFVLNVAIVLVVLATTAHGQGKRKPSRRLALSGTLTTGYYHADTKNGLSTSQNTILSSLRMNLAGYLYHPKFLTFEIKPQASLGRQSSETIFPDGRGVSVTSTFLGGNSFPLTVSYARLSRQITTFGPLDRLAGLEADTSQSSLNVEWRLRIRRHPQVNLNYSRYTDGYLPLAPLTPRMKNWARVSSVGVQDNRWGWQLDSQFRAERSSADLINVFDPAQPPYHFARQSREFRATASRDVSRWLRMNLLGGHTTSRNEINARPYDQSFSYFYGSASSQGGKKLTGTLRAGVTTNLVGFQLERALSGTQVSAPSSSTGRESILLVPSQAQLTLVSFSGQVQYALTKDLRLDSQLTRDITRAPATATVVGPETTLTTVQAGVSYAHDFRRWQLQARYARNVGWLDYDRLIPSRTRGHTSHASVTVGSVRAIELTASVQGYWQDTQNSFQLQNQSWGGGLSASRALLAGWKLRATVNLDKNIFNSNGTRFASTGHGFTLIAAHRRADLSFNRQMRDGLTFQPNLPLGLASPSQTRAVLAAFPTLLGVPSSFSWASLIGSVRPVRRLTARALWSRNTQVLSGRTSNHSNQWEATLGYRFRLLTFDVGYLRYTQDFGLGLFSRNRFFFRVVRDFRIF